MKLFSVFLVIIGLLALVALVIVVGIRVFLARRWPLCSLGANLGWLTFAAGAGSLRAEPQASSRLAL